MEDTKKTRSVEDLEINLLYIATMAMERIVDDIEKRLNAKKKTFHFEKKMRFNDIMKSIKNIKRQNDLIDQEDYAKGLAGNYESYQYYQEDAYELARILLLFADRHSKDIEVGNQIAKHLRSMETANIITEEVLDKFYLKK
jgi:predicted transcriptional regulator